VLSKLAILLLGAGVGLLAAILIVWAFQRTISTFGQSQDGWVYTFNTRNASTNATWDPRAKALRGEFDFALFGPIADGQEPRATFSTDHLLGTSASRWTGFKTLKLKVTNLTSHPLELTFSVFKQGCFYEFGDYQNLPPFETRTLAYDFLEPHYKTCDLPLSFSNALGAAEQIQRLDLILGVNVAPDALSSVKGSLLIDSVRLERDIRWLLFCLGVVIFVVGASLIVILRRKYPEHLEQGVLA
jgi:hypothetical protein